jgi:site-specific recombinase XerC
VYDKLDDARKEIELGIKTSGSYTVEQAVEDWLMQAMGNRAAKTVTTLRELLDPLLERIGKTPLRDLEPADVHDALVEISAKRSTRTLGYEGRARPSSDLRPGARQGRPERRPARNLSAGKSPGRPRKALTVDQAVAVLTAARNDHLNA